MLFDTDMYMQEELLCKHVCVVTKSAHLLRHVRPSVCMCTCVDVTSISKFQWYVVLGRLWKTYWENPDVVKIRNIGPFAWRPKYFSDYWQWHDVVQQLIECTVAFPWQCFQFFFPPCLQWYNYAWNMRKLFLQTSPKLIRGRFVYGSLKLNISFLIFFVDLAFDWFFSLKLPFWSSDPLQEFK